MFFWTDTEGIPLEMVAERVVRAGLSLEFELVMYVLHALKAGWKPSKIASELREAQTFGLKVPATILRSLDRCRNDILGIMHDTWIVICRTDKIGRRKGPYVLATRRVFPTGARGQADTPTRSVRRVNRLWSPDAGLS